MFEYMSSSKYMFLNFVSGSSTSGFIRLLAVVWGKWALKVFDVPMFNFEPIPCIYMNLYTYI
jgi:hypothetical protein